jgi:hypothetical protein
MIIKIAQCSLEDGPRGVRLAKYFVDETLDGNEVCF